MADKSSWISRLLILSSQVGLCPAASSPLQGKERCGDRQEQLDQPPTHTPLTGRPLSRRFLPFAGEGEMRWLTRAAGSAAYAYSPHRLGGGGLTCSPPPSCLIYDPLPS